MNISQTYYTSCRVGLRGGQGFQINAATPGLPADTLNSVERLGGYAPPLSSPSQPTPEEIESFPVSLVFSRLPNGDATIGQSKYLGKDATGRYGNFFAHFVVIPSEEIDDVPHVPVTLWRSRMWVTAESPTTELPLLRELEQGDAMDSAEIALSSSNDEDLRRFGQILSAVEQVLGGGLRLIIADQDERVARWIAMVTQVLPLRLAWQVSFTTYSKSPAYANVMIAGTTADSDFGFSDFEINYQYAVFDFLGNRFSSIQNTHFASAACELFKEIGTNLFAFPAFVDRVAPDLPLDELPVALACFAHIQRIGGEAPIAQLCDWCARHLDTLHPEEIQEIIGAVAARAGESMEGLHAVESLAAASMHADMGREVAPAFTGLVLRVLPTADLEWLKEIPVGLRALRAREIAPPAPVSLSSFTDPRRLCAAVSILDELGMLDGREDELRSAGRQVIAARLLEEGTRVALVEFPGAAANTSLMEGLVSGIEQQATDAAFLVELGDLFQHESILAPMEEIAARTRSAELSAYILAVRLRGRADPAGTIFAQAVAQLRAAKRAIKAADFDFAYDIVWRDQLPDGPECVRLLELFGRGPNVEAFGYSKTPQRMGQSILARSGSLSAGDIDCAQGLVKGFSKVLLELGDQLNAVLLCEEMGREPAAKGAGAKPAEQVKRAWEIIPCVDAALGARLAAMAARKLFEIPEDKVHRDRLGQGLKVMPEVVAAAYAKALREQVKQSRDPEVFVRLTRNWLILVYHSAPKDCDRIFEAISEMYRWFDRHTRSAISAEFEREPKLSPYWKDIVQAGSIFGIPRRWIGGRR
jgi:hypothetical protein